MSAPRRASVHMPVRQPRQTERLAAAADNADEEATRANAPQASATAVHNTAGMQRGHSYHGIYDQHAPNGIQPLAVEHGLSGIPPSNSHASSTSDNMSASTNASPSLSRQSVSLPRRGSIAKYSPLMPMLPESMSAAQTTHSSLSRHSSIPRSPPALPQPTTPSLSRSSVPTSLPHPPTTPPPTSCDDSRPLPPSGSAQSPLSVSLASNSLVSSLLPIATATAQLPLVSVVPTESQDLPRKPAPPRAQPAETKSRAVEFTSTPEILNSKGDVSKTASSANVKQISALGACMLDTLVHKYTLTFRDPVAEKEYRAFYMQTTIGMWRLYLCWLGILFAFMVTLDAIAMDQSVISYSVTPVLLATVYFTAGYVSFRADIDQFKHVMQPLSITLALVTTVLCVYTHELILQPRFLMPSIPGDRSTFTAYGYKSGMMYAIAVVLPCILLKTRFIHTACACAVEWVVFVGLTATQFAQQLSGPSTTSQCTVVLVLTLGVSLLTVVWSYDAEVSLRTHFMRSQDYIRANAKLADQLQSLGKGFEPILDTDSPLEKAVGTLKTLAADPLLKGDHVRLIVHAIRLLHSGNLMVPDLQSQMDQGNGDTEQHSWLMNHLGQRLTLQARLTKDRDRDKDGTPQLPTSTSLDAGSSGALQKSKPRDSNPETGSSPNIRNASTVVLDNAHSILLSLAVVNSHTDVSREAIDVMSSTDTVEVDLKLRVHDFELLVELDKADGTQVKSISFKPNTALAARAVAEDNSTKSIHWDKLAPHWEQFDNWDWNVFDFAMDCDGLPLVPLAHRLFHSAQLFTKFNIPIDRFLRCIATIERGYRSDLPYHNATHAADVLFSAAYFARQEPVKNELTDLEHLALYFAAIIHDHDHTGFSNNYLMAMSDPMSILYNDRAIQENHHLATSFMVLNAEENNFLCGLSTADRKDFRNMVIEMVLATDLHQHFPLLTSFRTKVSVPDGFRPDQLPEDRLLLLKAIVKISDVSNPSKTFPLYMEWCNRIFAEFYRQGDFERKNGLPVSAYMDRNAPNLPGAQVGFIEYVCTPLIESMNKYIPCPHIVKGLKTNYEYWYKLRSQASEQRDESKPALQAASADNTPAAAATQSASTLPSPAPAATAPAAAQMSTAPRLPLTRPPPSTGRQ
ncbi:hypothetical protein RI367_004323 [Sorochytrium milnesiophthora]